MVLWRYYILAFILALGIILWRSPKRRTIWLAISTYVFVNFIAVAMEFLSAMQNMAETGHGHPQLIASHIGKIIIAGIFVAILFLPLLTGLNIFIKRRRIKTR